MSGWTFHTPSSSLIKKIITVKNLRNNSRRKVKFLIFSASFKYFQRFHGGVVTLLNYILSDLFDFAAIGRKLVVVYGFCSIHVLIDHIEYPYLKMMSHNLTKYNVQFYCCGRSPLYIFKCSFAFIYGWYRHSF